MSDRQTNDSNPTILLNLISKLPITFSIKKNSPRHPCLVIMVRSCKNLHNALEVRAGAAAAYYDV